MSPGLPQTSLLEIHSSEGVMRSPVRRGEGGRHGSGSGGDVDHRAVGGHLQLSKRNSTPVGGGVGAAPMSHTHAHPATKAPSEHRRLDRSHSEPVKGEGRGGNSSRYKTELCRPFEENGFCKYGDKCQFAHGAAELRTLSRHPKYKTELCRTFHTIGFCPYGPRCHFIHNADERRGSTAQHSQNPLTAKSAIPALTRPHMLGMAGGGVGGLGSAAESPSPPASLHGSPTSPGGAFFDDAFTLFPGGVGLGVPGGLLDGLTVGLGPGGLGGGPGSPGGSLGGLDTPPVSPVESLAGDLDSLSISSSHSTSPTPNHVALDIQTISRTLRLPIFEQLCEHD